MSNANVIDLKTRAPIDPILSAAIRGEVPSREFEVLTIDRDAAYQILDRLEAEMPVAQRPESLHILILHLQECLGAEQPELWAVYSPGPGSCYPMLNKENAERVRQSMIDRFEQLSAKEDWELKTISVQVIPSPFHPDEHFQLLAEELDGEEKRLRKMAIGYHEQRDELMQAVAALLDENDTTPAAIAAKQLMDKITKESA